MLQTLLIIFEQVLLFVPLGLGSYISFSLIKVPDLSIESAYVFGAILASKTLMYMKGSCTGLHFISAILASMLAGLIVGAISSLLTKYAKLPHLLSSILTIGLFHGINQYVLGTSNMSLSNFKNPLITQIFTKNPELPTLFFIGIIITILGYFLLKSQLGFCFAVYGNNPEFFQHHMISTKFIFFCGLMLSNALAGLSGYLVAQSSGFVDINAGKGIALFCITFLILGKFLISKTYGSSLIPVIGLITYCALQQILLKIGFNLKYFTMIQSIIVICILINQYRNKSTYDIKDNLGI